MNSEAISALEDDATLVERAIAEEIPDEELAEIRYEKKKGENVCLV